MSPKKGTTMEPLGKPLLCPKRMQISGWRASAAFFGAMIRLQGIQGLGGFSVQEFWGLEFRVQGMFEFLMVFP